MRWFVTALLLSATIAGVGYLVVGDRVRTAVVSPPPAAGPSAGELAELATNTAGLRALTISQPGRPPLTLTRPAGGAWTQPGNWPLRDAEVTTLVNAIGALRSRFDPIPVSPDSLAQYGLDATQNPVKLMAEVQTTDTITKSVTLTVGRPADPELGFDRPCYARVGDATEVVRLGPDVLAVLNRPPEVYRRRQLVPDLARVALTGDGPATPGRTAIAGNSVTAIVLEKTSPATTIMLTRAGPPPAPRRDPDRPAAEPSLATTRLAAAWTVETAGAAAYKGRPDPAKLRAVLAAVPDLWAEVFVAADKAAPAVTGLDRPDRTMIVKRIGAGDLIVRIGNVARTTTRPADGPPPRPMFPGAPPPPPALITEEFRYAKLADNDQVFELRADKFSDLFSDPLAYRDPAPAGRFESRDAVELTVARRGHPAVKLVKIPGKPDADRDDDKADRWQADGRPADLAKVTELLDAVAGLRAKSPADIVTGADPAAIKAAGLVDPAVTVTVRVKPRAAPGDPEPEAESIGIAFGTADAVTKLVPVRGADPGRVTKVDAAALATADRPALAYRGRRLFDAPDLAVKSLTVTPASGEAFALAATAKPGPVAGVEWALTAPAKLPAATAKAAALADGLARAEVTEFVADTPTPADLDAKYGLAKPRFTVALDLAGVGPRVLLIGAPRPGKPDVFGRLAEGPVFALPQAVVDPLAAGPLALLSPEVWAVPGRVTAIEVARAGQVPYTLAKSAAGWVVPRPVRCPGAGSHGRTAGGCSLHHDG